MNEETTTTHDLDRKITRLEADLSFTQSQLKVTRDKLQRSAFLLLDIIGPELTKAIDDRLDYMMETIGPELINKIDARLDERLAHREVDADEEGEKIRQEVREMIADGDIHVNIDFS